MRISKNLVIAIFLFATCSILCSTRSEIKFEKQLENAPIKIDLNTEFSNYLFGQRIWVKVILTNNSESDFFLKEDFGFIGIRLKIFDPNDLRVGSAKQIHDIHGFC